MNNILRGAALVAQWRNSTELGNPAGPLFTGEFVEAEIVWEPSATLGCTRCSPCSGCVTHPCC
jgi:hypothetical protein